VQFRLLYNEELHDICRSHMLLAENFVGETSLNVATLKFKKEI
jgi:hypothetical protein